MKKFFSLTDFDIVVYPFAGSFALGLAKVYDKRLAEPLPKYAQLVYTLNGREVNEMNKDSVLVRRGQIETNEEGERILAIFITSLEICPVHEEKFKTTTFELNLDKLDSFESTICLPVNEESIPELNYPKSQS